MVCRYRKNCGFWRMRRNMMWRVHRVVWTERERRVLWGIPKPVESVTVFQQMADVSRY